MTLRRSCTFLLLAVIASMAISLPAPRAVAGWNLDDIRKQAEETARTALGGGLSNDEVIRGLKEALAIGARNAAGSASRLNGFYQNPLIKIPFPPEAQKVKSTVEALGMRQQVEEFVETLNRAAEEAAKRAAPIFLGAITSMTIEDGFRILNGGDDAATAYLKSKTTAPLTREFRPVVKGAIQKVQVTKYWTPIAETYNRIPLVQKVNPNLDDYVTRSALDGLFKLIANEEKKIRRDPAARVTELLKKVFGKS